MFKKRLKHVTISLGATFAVILAAFVIITVGVGGPMWLLFKYGPDINTLMNILMGSVMTVIAIGICHFLYWLFLEPLLDWRRNQK